LTISLIFQVSAWINEKLKVAEDENYRDPTNLQSKLQKHSTFEAELSTNKGRLDAVCKVSILQYRSCG
jgi:spectrin beta